MKFTTALVSAVLAFTSFAEAAPRNTRRTDSSKPLSLTAQLRLADTAADRFALLPEDDDFVFDFNKKQDNPGKGGELIAANRANFPALVGTGAGMAFGRIDPNMMTPFYQGSIHTQFNPDCEPATFIATFATEDFGTGQIADELVSLSDDVIAATFGQSIAGEDIDKVRQAVPKSIALGVDKCLETCGLKKRSI
ncbi:Spherulin-1B [Fusarium oxysporum f. sp. cubense race 1]|uniref:Spherulin-1B n=1 Tax=Fusarium oxysporum f. sp. cubense (strain race 1) TaxID=1229664 RepID=N4U3J2_FUSC1|nr:Spherulin-1B [Fusarium oxysporum f. sp. cubense race 1]